MAVNNFDDHADVLIKVQKAQDAELPQRSDVKEAKLFITEKDGQWDPGAARKMDGRFRGTFDQLTSIVDGISGEIETSDFTLRVGPSGGLASEDTAKTIDGLIRNIRNVSGAEDIFNKAARSNIIGGFDAWEVVQDWIDGDSFDQDIVIRKIPNASDSVWFDLASIEQSRSDANWAIKLVAIPIDDYNNRWPKGSGISIGDNAHHHHTHDIEKEVVTVGQLYFKKPTKIKLVRMTNGAVYKDDEKFQAVQDELAAQNPPVTIEVDEKGEEKRRERDSWRVWSRMLDGGDWLAPEEKTVFDFIPIVPIYGNFDIIDNKCIYFGKLKNLLDAQRVYNYAVSRDIEDGALSPAETTWMTDKQAEGNDYSKMNIDHVPVRIYNNDSDAMSIPFKTPGPQASSGLQTTMANMQQMITTSSNTFNAQQGNASSTQSGIAGLQQIEQGNIGSIKWFKSLEIAICQTGKIILSGRARVFDGARDVQIIGDDGTGKTVSLNKTVFDEDTGNNIVLNDLTVGEYDIECFSGPAFASQQKEAARAFETMAGVNPGLAERNMDLWLSNRTEPGMKLMAERERVRLFNLGEIPESQWTDEEKQQAAEAQAQAQQNPPPPDPASLIAQAEMTSAQAELTNSQTKQAEALANQQLKAGELQLKQQQQELDVAIFQRENDDKFNVDAAKISQGDRKLDQSEQQMIIDAQEEQRKLDQADRKQDFEELKTIVEGQQKQLNDAIANLKTLREASGIDTIIGVGNLENIEEQTGIVGDKLDDS